MKRLGLSNNTFSGVIPSELGQLQGASVFLKYNRFYNSSETAPLSLCLEREVNEFDLTNDTTLCPPERNDLSDFHDSAKGADWTNATNWMDEYIRYCDWKGVTCDDNKSQVTKLNLTNNGLSGRLSESIGNLTSMEVLDLSDNDIKVISSAQMHYVYILYFLHRKLSTNNDPSVYIDSFYRGLYQQSSASFQTSLICVSAIILSQERYLMAWRR